MKVMFLMGGNSIQQNHEDYPLYLTEINEKLVLEKQIDYCRGLAPSDFIFCIKTNDIKKYHVDFVVKQLVQNSVIVPINGPTKGALCTALLGTEYIDNDEELILMSIDDFIDDVGIKIVDAFRREKAEVGIVSFNSVHPRYSFAKLNDAGEVVEVSEKHPISKNALVSFYYFRHGHDFVECAKDVIRKDNSINGAFYISQSLNEMILRQKKISMYKVVNEEFHPLKTETQLAQYVLELKEEKESK